MTNRSRILIVLIAVLLAGCLLGVAGHQFFNKMFQAPSVDNITLKIKKDSQHRFAKRLQLTAEQEEQLNAILEDSRSQIKGIRTELESKVEAIRSATNERIAAILNEEQNEQFVQLLNEAKSHKNSGDHSEGKKDKDKDKEKKN